MDQPLGVACGNGLEVAETLEVLAGGGPTDVVEITLAIAREMLSLAGLGNADPAAALADGRAMEVWRRMITAQGGDVDAPLAVAAHVETVVAPAAGIVRRLDARAVGIAAWRLGAGRSRKEDPVSPVAGIRCLAKRGDRVEAGQPLLELHTDDPDRLGGARHGLDAALADGRIEIGPDAPEPRPLVIERID
jgi:thymidine phosphorylase